jgi:hypothetical protein
VVAYRDVVSARPELLEQAADEWDGLRVRFVEQVDTYTRDVHDRVHDGVSWTGVAADAARGRMGVTGRQLIATGEYMVAQGLLLREAAAGIRDCQYQLAEAQDLARAYGLELDGEGRVGVPPLVAQHNVGLNQDALAEHQQQVTVAERVATRIGGCCRGSRPPACHRRAVTRRW